MQDLRVGISAASSWAWGTSLVVGMEIAQTKGLLLVYRRGLKTSVLSYNVLLPAVMLCLVGIVCAGIWGEVPRTVYPSSGEGDILWALWGATVLFSGPVGDAQHWQRAGRRAYMIGSLFFTAYMVMILFVSSFQFNAVMDVCLLLAVICLTGSTMDSAAVALHAIAGKRAGTILALLVCVFWAALAGVEY